MSNNLEPRLEEIDDDEDIEDETILERIVALQEMFPESLRDGVATTSSYVSWALSKGLSFGRSAVWILSTSVVVLSLASTLEAELEADNQRKRKQEEELLKGSNMYRNVQPGYVPGMMPPPQQ